MSAIGRDPEQADPLRPSRETIRETLVERQIRKAMDEGAFDDLPHQGQRLPLDDDSAAGAWALGLSDPQERRRRPAVDRI